MNKLLTTITFLCFSIAANAEVFACGTSEFLTIFSRTETGFSREAHAKATDDEPAYTISNYQMNIQLETDTWLVLAEAREFAGGIGTSVEIINKETGAYESWTRTIDWFNHYVRGA